MPGKGQKEKQGKEEADPCHGKWEHGNNLQLHSLKLAASSPLKMDGWNTICFPIGEAYFQVICYFQGG